MSTAVVQQTEETQEFELAGRGARFGAAFLDGVIEGMVVAFIARMEEAGGPSREIELLVVGTIFAGAFLALNGYLLARDGQTLGKRMVGIKIVRTDGTKASLGRIVGLRYLPMGLIGLIPLLGGVVILIDALLVFRESRKCLHDQVADTIVVNA